MNIPTKITLSRIIAIVLMIIALFVLSLFPDLEVPYLFASDKFPGINLIYFILFIFFIIASYTDHLDGKLARKWNQITTLGKFLDPVADKLLINSLVIFLITTPSYASKQMNFSVWCAIILVARDIVIDALRSIAAQKGVVIAANIFGKMKTVFEMIAISFVLLNGFPFGYFDYNWTVRIADIFVYIATAMSFISGVIYIIENKNALKEN